jgi:hypothetical protein
MILTPNGHVGGVVQAPLHPVGRDRLCKTFIISLSLQHHDLEVTSRLWE